uniref:Alpha-2-macroglobulin RAP C-terminal domain-containing protein n=1 Tax=Panagrolaimus sp. JU765 TaxID=591449 RepID=A0AC34RNF3_9BILA
MILPVLCAENVKFRMEKLNYIWSKVDQKLMEPKRLEKLKIDLQRFDKLYISEKQDGEHQKKKSGSLTEIDQKLEQLLDRYDLEGALKAFKIKYKYEKSKIYAEESELNSVKKQTSTAFNDKRLIKLWERAKADEDLLSEELDDFFDRAKLLDDEVAKYNELLNGHKEQRSNHIDVDEEHDKTAVKLKKLNQFIEKELQDLNDILTGAQENPFHEKKARKLWAKVSSMKTLGEEELKSFKEDIRQFEKQLIRVDHHKKIIEDAKKVSASQFKDKEGAFHDEQIADLQVDQEKLERKAKKLESWINDRITALTGHQEL